MRALPLTAPRGRRRVSLGREGADATARSASAGAVVNGLLFVVSGIDLQYYGEAVYAYDPASNGWTTEPPIPTARKGLVAGVIKNVLYAVGGYSTGSTALATNEAYTFSLLPQTVAFTTRPPFLPYVGDTYDVTATGGGSGNPVVFSSLTPTVCTAGPSVNNASTVDPIAVGTCTVAANQREAPPTRRPPQVTRSFTVRRDTRQ